MTQSQLILAAIAIVSIAWTTPPVLAAEPCIVTQNERGVWEGEGNCLLSELLRERWPEFSAEFTPRLIPGIELPDLVPSDANMNIDATAPLGIGIEIKTHNIGQKDSPDFEIHVLVEVRDGATVVGTAEFTRRVAGIAAGDDRRDFIGAQELPTDQGLSVHVWATVDSNGSSTGGEIWESNEMNNLLDDDNCVINYLYPQDPCDD